MIIRYCLCFFIVFFILVIGGCKLIEVPGDITIHTPELSEACGDLADTLVEAESINDQDVAVSLMSGIDMVLLRTERINGCNAVDAALEGEFLGGQAHIRFFTPRGEDSECVPMAAICLDNTTCFYLPTQYIEDEDIL